MGKNSKIQWCDHTFNPWIGCTKVSAGCANCYAETQDAFRKWTPEGWGAGKPRKRTSAAYWRQLLKWNRDASFLNAALKIKDEPTDPPICGEIWKSSLAGCHRPRVFCASLADWLDPEVPIEWFVDLLRLWFICKNLDILALTKRPENWNTRIGEARKYFSYKLYRLKNVSKEDGDFLCWLCSWHVGESAPKNVWVGATVENKDNEKRIDDLLNIAARVRFLSCEPLLGPVSTKGFLAEKLGSFIESPKTEAQMHQYPHPVSAKTIGVDWVIAGGESGPNARPMHPDWVRSLRDYCKHARIPFFFKQWGEWSPRIPNAYRLEDVALFNENENGDKPILLRDLQPERRENWDEDWSGDVRMYRVGKKAAGRLLDGVEHNEFPEVRS